MMKNRSKVRAKKKRVLKKTPSRAKAHKKVSPAKKQIHAIRQTVNPDIEASARVKESIDNYHRGDTTGFAIVDKIWKFAESDQ